MVKTTLKIDGMMCGMCEAHINDVIRNNVDGVKKLKTSHKKGTSSFMSNEAPDEEKLKKAIADTGYSLISMEIE